MSEFLQTVANFFATIFPLHIFPAGGLASSVITTVWVGIFVVAVFNLRFGWVMSGLIVPGYLVPLLLIKPSAAAVVMVEGVLTYWLVWFYSEFLSSRMGWSRFFGRDRFFVLVLTSVAVRIVSDGYALPLFGEYANQHWQWQFDYQNNLHSFGLIITALVANNFWKTGLFRGGMMMLVTIGLTYCIVRFGLMELTNFSMSNIGFLYEDIATSFLASPKSYIILILTAFVASRMNLYYGWDFSGILIPSLLALQWFAPQKILMSMVEAMVILLLAHIALQAPIFKRITVEGARKVLLFFNLSFVYKLLLSHILLYFWPGMKVSDLYGFGYLLPTLIALKMHDKKIIGRMSSALLQTSLLATAAASLLGFGLSILPSSINMLPSQAITQSHLQAVPVTSTLEQWLLQEKQQNYLSLINPRFQKPSPQQSQAFAAALQLLQAAQPTSSELAQAAQLLHQANFELQQNGQLLFLSERAPRKFWGSYAINLAAPNSLLLEVPLPLDESASLNAGGELFQQLNARFLALAGSSRRAAEDGSADVLSFPNSFYHTFHRSFARRNTVQVRVKPHANSTLYVKGELPPQLSLTQLQNKLGHLQMSWQARPGEASNLQRDSMSNGFAELLLSPHDALQLAKLPPLPQSTGNISNWLAFDQSKMAASGSNRYRAPQAGELIYFDKDILTPLLASFKQPATAARQQWQIVNLAAQAVGYELSLFHSSAEQQDFLILAEKSGGQRYWGSVVFRLGARQAYSIQVPRPYFEPNSLEIGIALFAQLQAANITLANASPLANQDRSADILALQNKGNLLNLVSQVMLREAPQRASMTLQARALAQNTNLALPAGDVLLSFSNGITQAQQAGPLAQGLLQQLQKTGLRYAFADGSAERSDYAAAAASQAQFHNTGQNQELALIWASPVANALLRQANVPNGQNMQFKALGIAKPNPNVALAQLLAQAPHSAQLLPASLQAQFTRYLQQQDIVLLHEMMRQHPQLRFEYVVEQSTQRGYLLVWQGHAWLAAVNLASRDPSRIYRLAQQPTLKQAQEFIDHNHTWWLAGSKV